MDWFVERIRRYAEEKRLFVIEQGRSFSYQELLISIEAVRSSLDSEENEHHRAIALLCSSYFHFFSGLIGGWLCGKKIVPVNLSMSSEAQKQTFRLADVSYLLFGEQERQTAEGFSQESGSIEELNSTIGSVFSKRKNSSRERTILFTSGSTGVPKGAVLETSVLLNNARWASEAFGMLTTDRLLVNTPPYYTSGLSHGLATLVRGSCLVSVQGFQFGNSLTQALSEFNCTGFGGAPTHLIRALGETQSALSPHCRFWISSGDHLAADVISKTLKRWPTLKIYSAYGLTELGGRFCVLGPENLPELAGSVGHPIGQLKCQIVREDGRAANPFEVGEVIVRGPMMQGYLGQESVCGEFQTGDLGYQDPTGKLWFLGRKDDVIKSGAEKVSLQQVRSAINETGLCRDCAVLAVEDHFLGKVAHAWVVADKAALPDLRKRLRPVLSASQFPKKFICVKAIPRTGSGKVDRKRLLEQPQ